jgi:large subunit ribosomal protein L15
MSAKHTTEKALQLLRHLPRVQIGNIRNNPNSKITQKRGRGQHGEKIKYFS